MGDRLGILGAVNLLPFWPTQGGEDRAPFPRRTRGETPGSRASGQRLSKSSPLEPDGDQEGESAAPLAAGHWVSRATLLGGKRRPLVPASCPEAPCSQGQPDRPGLSLLGLLASFEKKVPIPKAYVTLLSI